MDTITIKLWEFIMLMILAVPMLILIAIAITLGITTAIINAVQQKRDEKEFEDAMKCPEKIENDGYEKIHIDLNRDKSQ